MAVFSRRSSCPLCLMTVNSASLLYCWPIYLLEPNCCSLSVTIGLFYHIWYLIFSALNLSLTALPSSFFPDVPSVFVWCDEHSVSLFTSASDMAAICSSTLSFYEASSNTPGVSSHMSLINGRHRWSDFQSLRIASFIFQLSSWSFLILSRFWRKLLHRLTWFLTQFRE